MKRRVKVTFYGEPTSIAETLADLKARSIRFQRIQARVTRDQILKEAA